MAWKSLFVGVLLWLCLACVLIIKNRSLYYHGTGPDVFGRSLLHDFLEGIAAQDSPQDTLGFRWNPGNSGGYTIVTPDGDPG